MRGGNRGLPILRLMLAMARQIHSSLPILWNLVLPQMKLYLNRKLSDKLVVVAYRFSPLLPEDLVGNSTVITLNRFCSALYDALDLRTRLISEFCANKRKRMGKYSFS